MSRNNILILLGTLIVLAPFSGLPVSAWRLLEIVLGAGVFSIGFSLRAREVRRAQAQHETAPTQVTPGAF